MRACILALILFAAHCAAQSIPPPDCQFTQSFTAATSSAAFSNKATTTGGTPCVYWVFTYWTNNATGVSIQFEGSPDVGGVSSGSYTALTALIASYPNPAIGTNNGSSILCCDNYPWVRLNLTSFTGTNQTMTVRVYGWRAPI